MSEDKLDRDAARAWLADRMGRTVTATLMVNGRLETADSGPLSEYADGYQIGKVAFVAFDRPEFTIEWELRHDDPDVDRLVAVVNGGGVEVAFRCEDEDRPPRIWDLNKVADELRRQAGR